MGSTGHFICAHQDEGWAADQSKDRQKKIKHVKIGGRNGVKAAIYEFRSRTFDGYDFNYAAMMIKGCSEFGSEYKPVCNADPGQYSKGKCTYLGQDSYLAGGNGWKKNNGSIDGVVQYKATTPPGLDMYKDKLLADNMCYYSGKKAICAYRDGHTRSKSPMDYGYKNFMCVKVIKTWDEINSPAAKLSRKLALPFEPLFPKKPADQKCANPDEFSFEVNLTFLKDVGAAAKKMFLNMFAKIANAAKKVVNAIKKTITRFFDAVKSKADKLIDQMKNLLCKIPKYSVWPCGS
jgi:hypothetical protein